MPVDLGFPVLTEAYCAKEGYTGGGRYFPPYFSIKGLGDFLDTISVAPSHSRDSNPINRAIGTAFSCACPRALPETNDRRQAPLLEIERR